MNLRDFLFLTDENIDPIVVNGLREQGLDIWDVKENQWFGKTDREILAFANQENRVIISQDSDFGTLIYRDGKSFSGIIFLRPGHFDSNVHIQTLQALLALPNELNSPFILVAENQGEAIRIRLRELPAP